MELGIFFVLCVSRAHVHTKCRRELLIRVRDEDSKPGYVRRWLRPLYEIRSATIVWDKHVDVAVQQSKNEVGLSSRRFCAIFTHKTFAGGGTEAIWCSRPKKIGWKSWIDDSREKSRIGSGDGIVTNF